MYVPLFSESLRNPDGDNPGESERGELQQQGDPGPLFTHPLPRQQGTVYASSYLPHGAHRPPTDSLYNVREFAEEECTVQTS